jgi:hypothetical protein
MRSVQSHACRVSCATWSVSFVGQLARHLEEPQQERRAVQLGVAVVAQHFEHARIGGQFGVLLARGG